MAVVTRWRLFATVMLAAGWAGCSGQAARREVPPLPVQQLRAHAEAVTGRFISLVDFEDAPLAGSGYRQVEQFRIEPVGSGGRMRYVVNITRTGVGAMEVALPPGARLVYRLPEVHDFSKYTVLSLSLHAQGVRDDLKVLLRTDRASWESPPILLKPEWNDVLIDLRRLKRMPDFDARGVREIWLWFAATGGGEGEPAGGEPVRFYLDDILLLDNRRRLAGLPEGMQFFRSGLDYELHLPQRSRPIHIRQGADGLWRLGADQARLRMFGPGPGGRGGGADEDLGLMGSRRVGEVEILERNGIRLRLRNTWYFPVSGGEWITLGGEQGRQWSLATAGVRQIRWEYTFYWDGRIVTDVVINNAGGREIAGVRITAPQPAAWSDGTRGPVAEVTRLAGDVARFSFLITPAGVQKRRWESDYLQPARLRVDVGEVDVVPGDAGGDGFDESQGCYRLRARAGRCRFAVVPWRRAVAGAVVRIAGPWGPAVTADSEGLALRRLVRLEDGSVLLVVPGPIRRTRWVEVTGPVGLFGDS